MSEEQLATVRTTVAAMFEHTPNTTPDGGFMATFAFHAAKERMACGLPSKFDKVLMMAMARAMATDIESPWAAMVFEAWMTNDQDLARAAHEGGTKLSDLEDGDSRRFEVLFLVYQERGKFPLHYMAEILRAPDGAATLREWQDLNKGMRQGDGNLATIFPIDSVADA